MPEPLHVATAPLPAPAPLRSEVPVAQILGAGAEEDGSRVGIQMLGPDGSPVLLTFPTELAGVLASEIQRGAEQAAHARKSAPLHRKVAVRPLTTFRVDLDRVNDLVLLALDPGRPGEDVRALSPASAVTFANAIGNAAQQLHNSRPRLIIAH